MTYADTIADEPPVTSEERSQQRVPSLYAMVDLFAGCGGLSTGFENAGFTPVFVNELNDDARATYLANRHHDLGGERFSGNAALHSSDAKELKGKRLDQLKADLASLRDVGFKEEKRISSKDLSGSNLDVIAGGPPCQGYSGIGHRRSYAVDKKHIPSNQLYQVMAGIIRSLRPRIFLFENVKGLLTSKWTSGGEDQIWPDVLGEFRTIPGYEVRWKLVHAKDYGVPQNRPRVLLVGIRRDILDACDFLEPDAHENDAVLCKFLPAGEPSDYPHLEDLLGDLVDGEVERRLLSGSYEPGRFETTAYPSSPLTPIQRKLRSAPAHLKSFDLTDQEYSKHAPNIVKKFVHMLRNQGEIPEESRTKKFSQRLLPPRWGNRGPFITATTLPDDYVHYSQPRILTVREWARLQLFPDWYQFKGKRTTGGLRRAGNPLEGNFDREVPKYTQIGNAVPVELAERVGKHFKLILDTALGPRA